MITFKKLYYAEDIDTSHPDHAHIVDALRWGPVIMASDTKWFGIESQGTLDLADWFLEYVS